MGKLTKVISCLLMGMALAHGSYAQDTLYWLGAVSTEWTDADNWSASRGGSAAISAPGSGTTAIIPSGTDFACILDDDAAIASLEIESGASLDVDVHSLGLTGDLKQFGGTFYGRSSPVSVGGQLLIVDGIFYSTTGTLQLGEGIYEQNFESFRCSTGTVRSGTATDFDMPSFLYRLEVPTGSVATMLSHLAVQHSIDVDGVINTNLLALYLDNTDDGSVTGSGGVFVEVDEDFGMFIWRIGEETGTYSVPLLYTLTGPVTPFDVTVTTAGTGVDGRILVTNTALPPTKPQEPFDGFYYTDKHGLDNSGNNSNHIWALIVNDFDISPTLTLGMHYDSDVLDGTTIVEANLQAQMMSPEGAAVWSDPAGTVDAGNNKLTVEGVGGETDIAQFWTLVDNSNPNYTPVDILYWTGAVDMDWENDGNWSWYIGGASAALVPGPTHIASFPEGSDNIAFVSATAMEWSGLELGEGFSGHLDFTSAELLITGGLVQQGGTIQFGEELVSVEGSVELSGGNMVAPASSFTVGGSFTETAEVFRQEGGTLVMTGGNSQILAESPLYKLDLSGGATVSLARDLYLMHQLILTDGVLNLDYFDVYILNGNTTAIDRTVGGIVSETYDFTSLVHWAVGENTGIYGVPFLSETGTYLPITYEVAVAGIAANGFISFGTFATDPTFYPNNSPAPPGSNNNNSQETIDRYWLATCTNYQQYPEYDLTFRYAGTDIGGSNDVDDQNLQVNYWDGEDWTEYASTYNDVDLEFTAVDIDFFSFWSASSDDLTTVAKGSTCADPVLLSTVSSDYVHSLEGEEFWFKHLTSGTDLEFSVCQMSSLAGIEIEQIFLYSGSCGSLVEEEDLMVTEPDNIVFSKSGLTDNTWYLVKLVRADNE